jgi:hypothetical protein
MNSYFPVLPVQRTYGAVQPPAKRRQTHRANGPQLSPGRSVNNSRILHTRQQVEVRRTKSHQGGSKKKTKMSKRNKISKH